MSRARAEAFFCLLDDSDEARSVGRGAKPSCVDGEIIQNQESVKPLLSFNAEILNTPIKTFLLAN